MKSYGTLTTDEDFEDNEEPALAQDNHRHIIVEIWLHLKHRVWQKKVLTAIFFIIGVLVVLDLRKFGYIEKGLNEFVKWIKLDPIFGFISLVTILTLAVVIFIPPTILIILSSFVFAKEYGQFDGIVLSCLACSLGAVLGANISYWRSKYITRDIVKLFSKRYRIIRAADSAFKTNGYHVMLLLRLCSIIPFSALNYIGGVTGVTLRDFNLSLVGIIPHFMICAIIGGTAESLIASNDALSDFKCWTLLLSSVIGLVALFFIIHLSRVELKKDTEVEQLHAKRELEQNSILSRQKMDYEKGVDDEEWFWIWV